MNPVDLGCDLYEPAETPEHSESGLVRRAPYQFGNWVAQPAYKNQLPLVLDMISSSVFTRSLCPAVAAGWTPDRIKQAFQKIRVPPEARWLQCLRVTPSNDLRNYAIIILDFMHPTLRHDERRRILDECIPTLGVRQFPDHGEVYLVPECPDNSALDLWYGLHLMNKEWQTDFYSGIVMKQSDAKYFIQKDDFHVQTLRWHLHKFTQPVPDDSSDDAS